uniref:Kringle domain-containing protein n=1 Tax=Macrostomum lignano TaxID=282301 RepID=A0A1I8G5A2_9PLAT
MTNSSLRIHLLVSVAVLVAFHICSIGSHSNPGDPHRKPEHLYALRNSDKFLEFGGGILLHNCPERNQSCYISSQYCYNPDSPDWFFFSRFNRTKTAPCELWNLATSTPIEHNYCFYWKYYNPPIGEHNAPWCIVNYNGMLTKKFCHGFDAC